MDPYGAKDLSLITQEKAHKAAESLGVHSGRIGFIWDKTKNMASSAWKYHAVRTFSSIFGILSGIPLLFFSSFAFLVTTGITGFAIVAWLLVVAGALGLGLVALVPVLFFTFCVSAIVLGGYLITRGIYNATYIVVSYVFGTSPPTSHSMKRPPAAFIQHGTERGRGLTGGAGEHTATYAEVAKEGTREHDKSAAPTAGSHSASQTGGPTGGLTGSPGSQPGGGAGAGGNHVRRESSSNNNK